MDFKTDADSSDVINNPRGVSPRLYLCTVCEKRCTTKEHLTTHLRKHLSLIHI